jgi:DNA-binding MurR/RpiR family transcriptional regulator
MADGKERNDNAPEAIRVEEARDVGANKLAADPDRVEAAPDRARAVYPKGLDKAAEILKQADHEVVVTVGESRRVVKLIDWRILPILL